MTKKAETSPRISSLAARMLKIRPDHLAETTESERVVMAANIRALAASVLRQDESPAPKKRSLLDKVLGR